MKKYLVILLMLLLAFSFAGCSSGTPSSETPDDNQTEADETAVVTPDVDEVAYAPYAIQFKNKTGVTMTGLYLYETGAADKGNSICPAVFPDADADKEGSMILTYLVRPADTTFELLVEWEDGTSATMPDLTIIDHDKFSMKDGVDPATWEHEPMDDDGEIADVDAIVAAGKTTDNFYGDYAVLGLEIKNKTGKDIEEFYLYEAGADYSKYNNMIDHVLVFDEEGTTLLPVEKPWLSGKGGQYVFSYFVRPVSDYYEVHLVYTDGATLTIPEIDLFTPNADGFTANEISMKSADDPFGTVPAYDDGDPEPLQYIKDALKSGPAADAWYPTF
jgi:hypothetical protein